MKLFRTSPSLTPSGVNAALLSAKLPFEFRLVAPILRRVSSGVSSINASTRYCAVLGHPIRHSASPAMQNAGLNALGLNWRYLAFDVPPETLQTAIEGARAMGFVGLNLTVPHKLLAVSMVDECAESATRWGAVNTIRFEGRTAEGEWKPLRDLPPEACLQIRSRGFNTDADAIVRSLREDVGCEPRGASVLLLGAGGAGQTAALRLATEGIRQIFLVNRTEARAAELARQLREQFPSISVQTGYPDEPVDLVLNATSLGLRPDDPLPYEPRLFDLAHAGAVYDMIYRPAETPLLKAARAAGRPTANGIGMLLYQGASALEIWTGQSAPLEAMREALLESVYGN